MKARTYRDLIVWQKAMKLVEMVYSLTRSFPPEERFGLTLQIRKASVSVPSNVAEGSGRKSTLEYAHFVSIASGSLLEVETQVLVAELLGYVKKQATAPILDLTGEVGRLLNGLWNSLLRRYPRH